MKNIIDALVDAKSQLEYYYSIHGVEDQEMKLKAINKGLRDLWEMDERKKEADRKIAEEANNRCIEETGYSIKELNNSWKIMDKFKPDSPEYKEAADIIQQAEKKQQEYSSKNAKA